MVEQEGELYFLLVGQIGASLGISRSNIMRIIFRLFGPAYVMCP